MNSHVFKRLLIFISPLLLLIALALYHSPTSSRAAHKKALEKMQNVIALWAQKSYVPLSDPNLIKSSLDHLQIEGPALTPDMRQAYIEALTNFFYAFSDGDIESWKRYRFHRAPENLTPYGESQIKFYFGIVKDTKTWPTYAPRDLSFLNHWFQGITANVPPKVTSNADLVNLFYTFIADITYGNDYRNYFQGVCFNEIIVKHDHYATHPPPLNEYPFFPFTHGDVGEVDATFPNLGYQLWSNEGPQYSFFGVHPTLTELLSEDGGVDCIDTFVYIKINEVGEVAPFLLRHAWNPKLGRWEIAEVVDAHLSSYNRKYRLVAL